MHLNPHIASNPIRDQNGFFGRDDILREIIQVGQPYTGKTSFLKYLLSSGNLKSKPGIQEKQDLFCFSDAHTLQRALSSLADYLAISQAKESSDGFSQLKELTENRRKT